MVFSQWFHCQLESWDAAAEVWWEWGHGEDLQSGNEEGPVVHHPHNTGARGTQGTGQMAGSEISKKPQLFVHSACGLLSDENVCHRMLHLSKVYLSSKNIRQIIEIKHRWRQWKPPAGSLRLKKVIESSLMEVSRLYWRSIVASSPCNHKLLQEMREQSKWTIGLIIVLNYYLLDISNWAKHCPFWEPLDGYDFMHSY